MIDEKKDRLQMQNILDLCIKRVKSNNVYFYHVDRNNYHWYRRMGTVWENGDCLQELEVMDHQVTEMNSWVQL